MKRLKIKVMIAVSGLLLLITFGFSSNDQTNIEFGKIWTTAYENGWCYGYTGPCIRPIKPIVPIPRIQDTTASIIYGRGFVDGRNARIQWEKEKK